jgi:DNA-binding NtrC family response regulator
MARAQGIDILIVDDDDGFRESLTSRLKRRGHRPVSVRSARSGLKLACEQTFPLALVDIRMPELDGVSLLKELKTVRPFMEVVLLTGYATVETAIEAMKLGAYDYLTKPFEPVKLDVIVEKAYEKWLLAQRARTLEGEVARLSHELKDRYSYQSIVGKSRPMQTLYDRIAAAARARSTILILGESGTGKELVARAIHYASADAGRPFVPVNCAALPHDLIESELFGYRKGSFTSASSDAPGLFKAAEGGTLFLDEITEMAQDTQAKLLRVLQEKAVRAVGAARETPVNVRVIASTNRDPVHAVGQGKLREDLYYRLSVAPIKVPPLREHLEDVPQLAYHFIQKLNDQGERTVTGIDDAALDVLCRYRWPGNVRELENVIAAAFTFGTSPKIGRSDLPPNLVRDQVMAAGSAVLPFDGVVSIREAERILIVTAMTRFEGNKTRVAKALGISRKQLYVKLTQYGLHGPRVPGSGTGGAGGAGGR